MINKTATVYTLSINLFFLGLCLVFGNLRFGAIDDLFMSGILSGIYGENNVHLTFVNALYGYCLLPLYYVFPIIGIISGKCRLFLYPLLLQGISLFEKLVKSGDRF